jgi:hypothetical protein
MTLTIDRPPTTGTPDLPPFLRKKGPERGRWIIMPDIRLAGCSHQFHSTENNWITVCYTHMIRFRGVFEDLEMSTIYHRRYRNWLETYECPDGIPPHIAFGGAIVAGEADPTFKPRWNEYARLHFV